MLAAIDLTRDSDDDIAQWPFQNRGRSETADSEAGTSDSDVDSDDSDDSDVEELSAEELRKALGRAAAEEDDGSTDDDEGEVVITWEVGQTATRDLPHPRPSCAVHRFTAGTSGTNHKRCKQCYCYVCDVKASECCFWGTGDRKTDHANAGPHKASWVKLRQAAKEGKVERIRRHFDAGRSSENPGAGEEDAPPSQRLRPRRTTRAGPELALQQPQQPQQQPQAQAQPERKRQPLGTRHRPQAAEQAARVERQQAPAPTLKRKSQALAELRGQR